MSVFEKNIAIVCNDLAGSGRATFLAERISLQLSGKQILHSLFNDKWPGDYKEFTDIWIVGGDGTLNYFVNHYPDIKIPLVIFNGGTGNDFHWLLYGSISFEQQVQLALSSAPKIIDLCRCNDKFFINGVGIGFEGEVAKSLTGKNKKAGKASFMTMILKKIFSYRSSSYSIKVDGKSIDINKYLIIDVSNGCRAGGGFHIAPDAKADDGLLDLVLINAISPIRRLRWLPVIEKGKHLHLPFIKHLQVRKVVVESDSIVQCHLDGEYYEANKLNIEILAGKMLFRY
ncbi:MAG TPA: diacylglycerol kinase family protein [Chitinophagaceae bacterium]|nr:diacylglycerol kinase family protein [Chitinophagaceae bacterium]